MEYFFTAYDDFLEVKLCGEFDPDAVEKFMEALTTHERWEPDGRLLMDETEFDAGPLTAAEVHKVVKAFEKRRKALGRARIVLHVTGEMEYGMNRMWGALADGKTEISANIFRSRAEAIAWLTKKR